MKTNMVELEELEQESNNTISASDMFADIMRRTNLCIAGTTGSGKSVFLRNIIHQAAKNENVIFALIDLKNGATLFPYRDLPQTAFYAEYSGGNSLYNVFDVLCKVEKIRQTRIEKLKTEDVTFPTIFLLIDEFPKLTRISDKKLKKSIMDVFMDILAMGRESNIFPIIATQEVTKEILGSVKSVVNSWVALNCANAQESRNILGHSGAEQLPRYGQCIYKPTQRDEDEQHCENIPNCTKQDARNFVDSYQEAAIEPESQGQETQAEQKIENNFQCLETEEQIEVCQTESVNSQQDQSSEMAAILERLEQLAQIEQELANNQAQLADQSAAILKAIWEELQQQRAEQEAHRANESAKIEQLDRRLEAIEKEQQRAREAAEQRKRKSPLAWLKSKLNAKDRVKTFAINFAGGLFGIIAVLWVVAIQSISYIVHGSR